jgi:hypothetical protein
MKKFLFLSLFLIFAGSTLCQASSKISGEQKATMTAATTTLMAGGAVATMRQLEAEANDHLSNYSGDDDYEGYSGYTGANDDFLDFGGEPGNLMAAVEGHNYTVTIVNAKNAARTIYFMPSCKYRTKDNALTVGTLTDGTFAAIDDVAETNITATSDTYGSVDFLRRFIENNPTNVKAFQIQSSTAAGIQQCRFSIEEVSPFRQLPARILKPTMYQDQNMFNDKVINIPAGFDLNDQCVVKLTIAASTTLTITVVCGAILNGAGALQNKRAKAHRSAGSFKNRR